MAEQGNRRISQLDLSEVEFRGETIYFIVLDRFHDGNPENTPPDDPLTDPTQHDWGKYWGGDLEGVIQKLDYLQHMGVTAIWLTPLFEQVETFSYGTQAPVHGYWTRDFKRINRRWVNDAGEVRLFTRDDTVLDRLIDELHRRGMKFVLDIVCNHSSPRGEEGKGKLYDDGKLVADFDNDVDHWYHHYGEATDLEDIWQVLNCELSGLATFNENNIHYRNYIKSAIRMWLDKGVDALRIDTVKHMPLWFWQEFTADLQSHNPSIFIFGEYSQSHPDFPISVEYCNRSGMTLNDFGVCNTTREVLGMNAPEGFVKLHELYAKDHAYDYANEMVTFFENHDMPRLMSLGADLSLIKIATTLLLTGRGVPCFLYGTEQGLHNDTGDGNNPYSRPMMEKWDEQAEVYGIIQRLAPERRRNRAIQWGSHRTKFVDRDVYAYIRRFGVSRCFTLLNKGGERRIDELETELMDGEYTCLVSGCQAQVRDGKLRDVQLRGKDILVLAQAAPFTEATVVICVMLNGIQTKPGERICMTGNCEELGVWDLDRAVELEYINDNLWMGEVGFNASAGVTVAYKYVLFDKEGMPQRENHTARVRPLPQSGFTKWRDRWES